MNSVISDEGLSKEYGLAIGRNLDLNCRKGLMTRDLTTNSMIAAAAGADARMAGAPVSVVANSGSGNQGITATMPVVAAARWLDIDEPTMLRAVTLSNLIAIRIKSKFGRLSNLCGATVAGTGAACGITYLLGGGYHEICCAIQNMVGNVTGMVCDGAKADCALKISTCVNAACQAAAMGTRGVRVQSTDGIVEENVERTLQRRLHRLRGADLAPPDGRPQLERGEFHDLLHRPSLLFHGLGDQEGPSVGGRRVLQQLPPVHGGGCLILPQHVLQGDDVAHGLRPAGVQVFSYIICRI